jgi:hypothetical protein
MSGMTLAKLLLETATGQVKERTISPEEVKAITREISERVTPQIEEIREKQRRSLEDTKPVVLL